MTAANKARGEAQFEIGGLWFRARLTLDTLARLEDAFGVEDFTDAFDKVFGEKVSAKNLAIFLRTALAVSGAPEARVEEAMALATVDECLAAAVKIMETGGFREKADEQAKGGAGASPLGGKSAGSSGAVSASATSGSRRKRSGA